MRSASVLAERRSARLGARCREAVIVGLWRMSIAIGSHRLRRRRLTFFLVPCPAVLTRFRLLITSVLRLIGRGRPCSLRKRPHALQRTEPSSSRRHNGVVEVVQLWQTGCRWARSASVMVDAIMARVEGVVLVEATVRGMRIGDGKSVERK